jgi:DNA-binding NarL/FixJ family response regulator
MGPRLEKREASGSANVAPLYECALPSNVLAPGAGANGTTLEAVRNLTPRQREVLAVMMQGKCNKAICRSLKLAEPTVKNHVTAILKALNATNRTEAVLKAVRATTLRPSYTYTISAYSSFFRG